MNKLKNVIPISLLLLSSQAFSASTLMCSADVLYDSKNKTGLYEEDVSVHIMDNGVGIISTATAAIYTEKPFIDLEDREAAVADRGDAIFILHPTKDKGVYGFGMSYKNSDRPAIVGICKKYRSIKTNPR